MSDTESFIKNVESTHSSIYSSLSTMIAIEARTDEQVRKAALAFLTSTVGQVPAMESSAEYAGHESAKAFANANMKEYAKFQVVLGKALEAREMLLKARAIALRIVYGSIYEQ